AKSSMNGWPKSSCNIPESMDTQRSHSGPRPPSEPARATGSRSTFRQSGSGMSTDAVRAEVAGAPPHNLPLALTTFIGRERELEEVRHLLRSARLLTLVGSGGAGKTR